MSRHFFNIMRSSAPSATEAAAPERAAPPPPPNMKQDAAAGVGVHLDPTLEAVRHDFTEEVDMALELRNVSAFYGSFQAIDNMTMPIPQNRVTALIGPSGCGKSTLLRCFNRMNDLIPGPELQANRLRRTQPGRSQRRRRRSPPTRSAAVFRSPTRSPKIDILYENVAFEPASTLLRRQTAVEGRATRAALLGRKSTANWTSPDAPSSVGRIQAMAATSASPEPRRPARDHHHGEPPPPRPRRHAQIEDLMRRLAEPLHVVVVHPKQICNKPARLRLTRSCSPEKTRRTPRRVRPDPGPFHKSASISGRKTILPAGMANLLLRAILQTARRLRGICQPSG